MLVLTIFATTKRKNQFAFVHGNLSLFVANSRVRIVVFNATFNNISVISWQSVLLVEETGVPGDNHRVASH
jgi:hypothetical protein